MSSNWTQNREFIAALNKNFAQLPQSFADFWTSTGGSINEGGYVSALGDVLRVQFQDLVTQLSTGNASNASEQRTTPQSAYSTPFDFQLEQSQPTVALSLCDLHPEQLQSSHPPPGPRRLLSLPPIQTIQTKLPPTSPIQPLPKSPLTATPPPIPQSLSHSKPRSTAPSNPSPCSTPSTPTMTRTRGMDKLSAVKNAKTRGGKARVLNAVAKKRLVMDSATIAVPVEPRAPKRTLPAPESVEPARPPTPIRMDEKGPATAVEYTGTEQSAVLKAGWSIIRRYFFDEVGADAVLNYLKTVKDPVGKAQLQERFSAAMSCEDDEARNSVAATIEERLQQYDRAPTTKPGPAPRKKRKTTFKPNFGAPEAASRFFTPTKHTPRHSPTPFPSPRSPSASSTARKGHTRLDIAVSSLPPSSPCPSNLSVNVGETFHQEEDTPGTLEKTSSPNRAVDVEEAPPGQRKKKNPKKLPKKPSTSAPAAPAELDDTGKLTDEEEEAEEQAAPRRSRKGKEKAPVSVAQHEEDSSDAEAKFAPRKARKGKGKAPAPADEEDKSDQEEHLVKKRGRLSRETIEQAHALRQTYHDELEALALKDGKSLASLLAAVGDTVLDNRSLNPWNAFQAYATHPEGLGMERQEDQSIADFNAELLAAYRQKRAEAEDVETEFEKIMDWYREQLDLQTARMRMEGMTEKQLQKIVKPFNARGRQAYEFYGASVFGFVVDPVTSHALAFGADPMYLGMKETYVVHASGQLRNYSSMIHLEWMKKKFGEYLDPAKLAIIKRFHDARNDHEVLRTILKDVWLLSLNEAASGNTDIRQLKWGPNFADLCYNHKVKLVNYPIGLKPLGVPDGLQGVSGINIAQYVKPIIKDYVQFWQQEAELKKAKVSGKEESVVSLFAHEDDYEEKKTRQVFEDDLVRFMPWDEDEKDMDMAEEAHIGIVLQETQDDGEPLVLAKVLHSKKFLARAAARKVEIQGLDDEPEVGEGDSESDVVPAQKKNGQKAPLANRKKRSQREDESGHNERIGRKQRRDPGEKSKKRRVVSDEESEADASPPPASKKPKKTKNVRGDDSESDVAPPPPASKKYRKPDTVRGDDSEADVAPPPPAPKKPKKPKALREEGHYSDGAAPPAPKTKASSSLPTKPKKATTTVSEQAAAKAGPSIVQEERPIAPRPRPRHIERKANLEVSSSSDDEEQEQEERPPKRARVDPQVERSQATRKPQAETREGANKRKRGR